MPLNIIVGAQWGDEGKGRYTDLLAAEADVVGRFSGGDNAGHTVTVADEVFKLHLIPSGIIHEKAICVIGNGVVLNPAVLLREMAGLAERGVNVRAARLKISRAAHIITPAHIALDKAKEMQLGKDAIGTTLRGIGPAYTDKIARAGLRAGLFADPETLAEAIHQHVAAHNETLTKLFGAEPLDAGAIAAEYAVYAQKLAPHLVDSAVFIDEYLQNGRSVLAEGAQGTFLDIDHGTYPFVTSSSPTAGGALTGLGVGPKQVGRVIGVAKAFTSRVGSGPFPCETDGETAVRLRGTGANPWDEFGTTTGRPRRVGWLDLVMLRHARRINSFTDLALTKLDILSGLAEIPVCVAYKLDGKVIDYFPYSLEELARCEPVFDIQPGWQEDITGVRAWDDLPAAAQQYITYIAQNTQTPISSVSVGPGRAQVVQVTEIK
ncbi:MAG: adenylosuccinate synthase [Chloroflexota bacterium]